MDFRATALAIAGVATALACLLSSRLIVDHLRNWKQPAQQKRIIIIILMVPLFAIDSFIGLVETGAPEWVGMVLDSVKECYEAVVLWAFLSLMYAYLGVSKNTIPPKLEGRHIHLVWPLHYCMKELHLNSHSVGLLTLWTTQFIVLRPVLSLLSIWLDVNDQLDTYYTYISVVLNISVTMSVTALMLFYHAFADELKEHRPLAQFLCIKGVVFFAFWQGVIVEIFAWLKILREDQWYKVESLEEAIQNFLVCVEMGLLFSFAHAYAFTAQEFKDKKKV